MARILGVAMATSIGLMAATAAADSDDVATKVSVRLVEQRAHFVVEMADRRRDPHWTGGFAVPLPVHGTMVGGRARANGETYLLKLEDQQSSEALLQDAESRAPSEHRLGAVVVSTAGQGPWVDALMPRGGPLSVSLDVESPTCFVDGDRFVAVPNTWRGHLTGAAIVAAVEVATRKLEVRCPGADAIGESGDVMWIEFAGVHGKGAHDVALRAAQFVAGNSQIARVQLEMPEQFSTVPNELHTVLLFDRSRSISDDDSANQRRIATAYLDGTPIREAQAIVFARFAQVVSRGWLRGDALTKLLPSLTSGELHNGSNFDEALHLAGTLLAALPTKQAGARRVIVFTDERMAARLAGTSPATLAALLPAGTLIQVVDLLGNQYDREILVRDDTQPLAALAKLTGGVAAFANAVDDDVKTVTATNASLLVRPHSIDFLHIADQGWSLLDQSRGDQCFPPLGPPGDLREGEACAWTAARAEGFLPTGKVRIEGQVWGQAWSRLVDFGVAQDVTLARDLTAGNGDDEFVDKEFTTALFAGAHAVNTEHALVARWGGKGGYSDVPISGISGTCGCDSAPTGSGFSHGGPALHASATSKPLREQFAAAFESCPVANAKVHLTVEMTRDEIVEVAATVDGGSALLPTCISEALWASAPWIPSAPEHDVLSFDY